MSLKETELKLQGKPFKWLNKLPLIVEQYNNTIHSTTKLSPVEGSKPQNEVIIKKRFLMHTEMRII